MPFFFGQEIDEYLFQCLLCCFPPMVKLVISELVMLLFHATFEAFSLSYYHEVGPQSCYFDRELEMQSSFQLLEILHIQIIIVNFQTIHTHSCGLFAYKCHSA